MCSPTRLDTIGPGTYFGHIRVLESRASMCALDRLEHLEQEERAPDSLPPTLDAAALKRERAELHAHIADGVIVADAAGRIVFANEAALESC